MTTPFMPDDHDDRENTDAADVVNLDAARGRRAPSGELDGHAPGDTPETSTGHDPDATADTRPDGAVVQRPDTTPDAPVLEGEIVRVDRPGEDRADWLADLAERARTRRPIVPAWLRSRSEATATARWVGAYYVHVAGYHASRLPKYAAKVCARAPRGASRLIWGVVRWTFDLEGEPVRLAAVQKADPETYLRLSRQRDARVRLRVWVAGATLLAVTVSAVIVAFAAPAVARWAVLALAIAVCGALGKVADRPLIDRAVVPTAVEKLTSDVVIRALTSLSIAGINPKDANIRFVAPITRDGPGWRADVDLPYGVTVADVLDRRTRLASALRRPLGSVWPEGDPTVHEGRLILWVGDKDLSKTTVRFALLKASSHDVFAGVPFGADPRGRPVTVPLIQHNTLIGSLPGQGKTSVVRVLACGAALDPTAELWIHELKGTGDLDPLEKVSHRYVSGIEDDAIAYAAKSLKLLRAEVMRRTAALKQLPVDLCPDKRITRHIADRPSLGLRPLVCVIDECQNLFSHADYGARAGDDAEFIIKLGRAIGVHLMLATQRPDKDSLPTGVSANVSVRFCLKVGGQVENDMILGTSAYKQGIRATAFVPETDAGIGWLAGATPVPKVVRGAYLDTPATQRIADRARALRDKAGMLTGHALGETPDTTAPAYDLLADILAVVPADEPKLWGETVAARLAELRPDAYGRWGDLEPDARSAQLTNALRPYGVRTGQVWGTTDDGTGANRRGITRDDIHRTITQRDSERGSGGV